MTGVSGQLDVIAQRTMQGKNYLYATLRKQARLSTVFGYETSAYRQARGLPKMHVVDALCVATLHTGEAVPHQIENVYRITFRPRQTRKLYHSRPRKGQGRGRS